MTRMTREFTLVLLGSGMLAAAAFAWPEQDLEKKAEEQAQNRVCGSHHRTHAFIWIHGSGIGGRTTSPMRTYASTAGVSRGGFGGTAARVGGGSMG